jgi:hypothetical protein
MKFEDCYPAEIVEWAKALPEAEQCTAQQRRILQIIEDEEVIKKAAHVLKQLDRTLDRSEATQRIDDFCTFIEDAAALPDQTPGGARWHVNEYAEFYTRHEVKEELQQIKLTAQPLAAMLNGRSDLIIFDKIEELRNLLNEFLASPQMVDPFDDDLPNCGRMAGPNNWRNTIYQNLCNMAEVRLGNRYPAFVREVHRVLLDLEMPLDANTAHHIAGSTSKLIEN